MQAKLSFQCATILTVLPVCTVSDPACRAVPGTELAWTPASHPQALFAHALGDDLIALNHSQRLRKAYRGPANLIKFAGDHNSRRPPFFYDSATMFCYTHLVAGTSADPTIERLRSPPSTPSKLSPAVRVIALSDELNSAGHTVPFGFWDPVVRPADTDTTTESASPDESFPDLPQPAAPTSDSEPPAPPSLPRPDRRSSGTYVISGDASCETSGIDDALGRSQLLDSSISACGDRPRTHEGSPPDIPPPQVPEIHFSSMPSLARQLQPSSSLTSLPVLPSEDTLEPRPLTARPDLSHHLYGPVATSTPLCSASTTEYEPTSPLCGSVGGDTLRAMFDEMDVVPEERRMRTLSGDLICHLPSSRFVIETPADLPPASGEGESSNGSV
jgi:hypothetical protein